MMRIEIGTRIIFVFPNRLIGLRIKLNDGRMRVWRFGVHAIRKKHDIAIWQHLTVMLMPPIVITSLPFEFPGFTIDDRDQVDLT